MHILLYNVLILHNIREKAPFSKKNAHILLS